MKKVDLNTYWRYEGVVLLKALLALIILSPIVVEAGFNDFWLSILWAISLIFCVINSANSKAKIIFFSSLALLWMAFTFNVFDAHLAISAFLAFIMLVFTIVLLLRKILTASKINLNIISLSVSTYLLLGVAWTAFYAIIFHLNPAAFFIPNLNIDYVKIDLMYYSFVTLTTLGYGDILPLSPTAKIFAAMQSVTGVLYLAVLVARLVSLYERT